jgi:hypothetical protein
MPAPTPRLPDSQLLRSAVSQSAILARPRGRGQDVAAPLIAPHLDERSTPRRRRQRVAYRRNGRSAAARRGTGPYAAALPLQGKRGSGGPFGRAYAPDEEDASRLTRRGLCKSRKGAVQPVLVRQPCARARHTIKDPGEGFRILDHREMTARDLDRLNSQELPRHESFPVRLEDLVVKRVDQDRRNIGVAGQRIISPRRSPRRRTPSAHSTRRSHHASPP